ncbi:MAG: hypothetical protein ACK56I_27540, partial [bacterium]
QLLARFDEDGLDTHMGHGRVPLCCAPPSGCPHFLSPILSTRRLPHAGRVNALGHCTCASGRTQSVLRPPFQFVALRS